MRCIAHRGFAETYPENTVAAVRAAADHTDVVEIDVRRCDSGDLVVFHDERVGRVTEATGRVADLPLADLESLDVLGSGEGVPSLATVFEAVPDVEYVLDIKEHGLVSETLDLVDDYGVSATVSAFDSGILEAAADASDLPLAYLVEAGAARTGIETATALGCDALHPHWTACVDELVAEAHERGLEVNAWTVPSRRDANALEHVDIDGLIVDRPEVVFDRD